MSIENSSQEAYILSRLADVRASIRSACDRVGRRPEEIRLVAVSKSHPVGTIRAAWDAGQGVFGESRVQEAQVKIPELPPGIEWHFIGHLQKNKIRAALPLFSFLHSIDSLPLASDVQRIAEEAGHFPKILLQANVSGEASKFGFPPDRLRSSMEELLALDRLEIHGLMTLAPYAGDPESARPCFRALRELRDALQAEFRVPLPELSMGMSGDYPVAIEEGATIVRVGTAIFGERTKKHPPL